MKAITSGFEDVRKSIDDYKEAKRKELKARRKLKTLETKYSFLARLTEINGQGSKLEEEVRLYFKALGFKKVEKVGTKYKEEDLRIFINDKLILVEVTGNNKSQTDEDKGHAITKHISIKQSQYPDLQVLGLFVFNHDNTRPFNRRSSKPFSNKLINIALHNKYSLISTVELLKAFIKIKKNELTLDDFTNKLCNLGEVKY